MPDDARHNVNQQYANELTLFLASSVDGLTVAIPF